MLQRHAFTKSFRTQYFLKCQLLIVRWLRHSPPFNSMKSEDSYIVSSRPELSLVRRQFSLVYNTISLLDTFAKLRKQTFIFVMSVRLSFCPSVCMKKLRSNWTNFHEILYFSIFSKIFWKHYSFIKLLTRITGILHEEQHTFFNISRSFLFRIQNI
jgi:hypothetical protein